MSNQFRAKWKDDSIREAEVEHFKKLKVAENFLNLVVKEATVWAEEKEAAIKAGMDPAIALFGHRACGVDAFGNPLPECTGRGSGTNSPTAGELEPDPNEKPAKKAKPRPYKPRIYAPQMIALGARAATMLLDLVPFILETWKRLVNAGIDPRRLALEKDEAKMAALLFEEIGVQYRDLDAGDYDRVKAALDQIEAWIQKMKDEERKRGAASAAPGEANAADSAQTEPPPGPTLECAGLPALSGDPGLQSGGPSMGSGQAKPPHSKDSPSEESAGGPRASTREAAPYSGSGSALDWTKL